MAQWVLFKLADEKRRGNKVLVNLDLVESIFEPDNMQCLQLIMADGRGIKIDCPAEQMLLLVNATVIAP
jgi:hypothetical protein